MANTRRRQSETRSTPPATAGEAPAVHGEPFHQETSDLSGSDPYADLPKPVDTAPEPEPERKTFTFLDGASFILDRPERIPAIWGESDHVLWSMGESLMIAGPQGVGKTTLAGQLMRARLGVGPGEVLGLPVEESKRLLYLAMDRPSQIARAFSRLFAEADRKTIARKLVIHRGPLPQDLAKHPEVLLGMCLDSGADTVMVDSVKHAAVGLVEDEVGARYNRARQHALQAGIQVIDLHHTKKKTAGQLRRRHLHRRHLWLHLANLRLRLRHLTDRRPRRPDRRDATHQATR
ncbi:AAA family ATPase [Rhodococcoides fascians]|uniref:AAA family ATPase n=1 Tax=Rhodococcoides fascians TaxID=1828 RepID=UPI00068A8B65|nr:AAA family ATPase [Rhodococcus fascians]